MGGNIEIESEIGKGSTFSFTFKAKRGVSGHSTQEGQNLSEAAMEQEEKQTDNRGIFKGYKTLLAEDVEINREIVETLVEPTLMELDFAVNGIQAVAMFKTAPYAYDLILMDVQMPEMDGYEATRRIRKIEAERRAQAGNGVGVAQNTSKLPKRPANALQGVPIIAMTANVFREDIENCLKAGMNDHIGKPIDMEEFFGMLHKYLPGKH